MRYAETIGQIVRPRVNLLYGWAIDDRQFFLSSLGPDAPEIEYALETEFPVLLRDLYSLGVARVDVMHSIGFDGHLDRFLDALGVPFDMTLLDYHQFATHPHLLGASGSFVGDEALGGADPPLLRSRQPAPRLLAADRVIACSRDLAGRVRRLVPRLRVVAAKLPESGNPERFAPHGAPLQPGHPMRVLVLGRIASHKGARTIIEVADRLRRRRLPIRIDCLGAIDAGVPLDILLNPDVRLLGRYRQEDLNPLICRLRPHLAWFPFTAPETHSFALSDAMLQGLPILATGIGAVVERLAGRPATWMMAPGEDTPDEIVAWLERLQRDGLGTAPRWLSTSHLPAEVPRFYEREYLRPLARSE